MTQDHPIQLTDSLFKDWIEDGCDGFLAACEAARWGADKELEACISAILAYPGFENPELFAEVLFAARRPPSLKDQALAALHGIHDQGPTPEQVTIIRRALEALDD